MDKGERGVRVPHGAKPAIELRRRISEVHIYRRHTGT